MNDYEDSRNALYYDPNAYIQRDCGCKDKKKGIQKVVFQEPYECMPSYHTDNNFKKGNCDCIPKDKSKCNNQQCNNSPSFDIKKLLPLLSSLGKGGGISDIMNSLGGNGGLSNILSSLGGGGDLSSLLSNLGGSGGLGSLLNGLDIFKLFKKKESNKPTMKSTDIPIRDYKRVE